MTATVTFDGAPLTDPAPLKPRVIGTKGSEKSFEITIEFHTEDFGEIQALQAKAQEVTKTILHNGEVSVQSLGTCGSLVIAGCNTDINGTYTNCYIDGKVEADEQGGTGGNLWKGTISFVKDCAA